MQVLILEDETLLALDLTTMVEELGHAVVGPFDSVGKAKASGSEVAYDFALLDYNLGGETSAAFADELVRRNLPFAFLTGHARDYLEDRFKHIDLLNKPVQPGHLKSLLARYAG